MIATTAKLSRLDRNDDQVIKALAGAASRLNKLLTDKDLEALDALNGIDFFGVQIILCEVIPHLRSAPAKSCSLYSCSLKKEARIWPPIGRMPHSGSGAARILRDQTR